eukprot:g5211.t1
MDKPEKGKLKSVQESFPIQVSGCEGVFYCGFTDEKSFGACSYFVNSPNGNVLVDCPRFNPALIKQFDSLGGIKFIFLTHKDDIGDHEKWAKHYKATRIIHKLEVQSSTQGCEIQLEGEGPWTVGPNGDSNEMEIISTPGHTDGSLCLLHKPSQTMFTGDHFAYSGRMGRLSIFPRYNRYGIQKQFESVLKLADYDFVRILPGHGRRVETDTPEIMKQTIRDFVTQNDP